MDSTPNSFTRFSRYSPTSSSVIVGWEEWTLVVEVSLDVSWG